ncbi:glycogen debranching enzyme N-terminal domain-containing protein [Chitinophaga pollutisoli]|uniref:Glycogen debranching enzyme N-terminal domain-containing protein n=1 Tax=Chitinophaga pollutisoli TaxID=3133966 RepID=A0ABZ2YMH7_9BACT
MIRNVFNRAMMSDAGISLAREYLLVAPDGTYSAASISGCNTRKYHGLIVSPGQNAGSEYDVILSALDETLYTATGAYNLATHRYAGRYYQEGYRFIQEFTANPVPQWSFSVGGVLLQKDLLFDAGNGHLMIRYRLDTASGPVRLRLMPLLAFRNAHWLSCANNMIDATTRKVRGGIVIAPYQGYRPFYMQLSDEGTFTSWPEWYYHFEYAWEEERGYGCQEDLFTPGYFEITLQPGTAVVFTAGFRDGTAAVGNSDFETVLARQPVFYGMEACLRNAAKQFIVELPDKAAIRAGFFGLAPGGAIPASPCRALRCLQGISGFLKKLLMR